MKRPNITPGPWKQDSRSNAISTLTGEGKHLATFHRDGNTTAQIHPSAKEAEANAQAIAAVPALLEALESMLETYAPYHQQAVDRRGSENFLHPSVKKTRTALIAAGYQF